MEESVVVLLSSYNGEKYIKEQIDSILLQSDVSVELLVRDDGSSDKTRDILSEYQRRGLLQWYGGANLKPAKSFWDLIESAPESKYYAFADQDDFWMPDKLSVALKSLSHYEDIPAMYCSAYQMTDKNLNPIPTPTKHPIIDIYHAMIENVATGCTMVLNHELLKVIRNYRPDYYFMHDEWIYKVCVAIGGKVIYDMDPRIYYRQHGNNVIGGIRDKWYRRIIDRVVKMFKTSDHHRYKTLLEISKGYNTSFIIEHRQVVEKCLSYNIFPNNIALAFNMNFYKGLTAMQSLKVFFLFLLMKF